VVKGLLIAGAACSLSSCDGWRSGIFAFSWFKSKPGASAAPAKNLINHVAPAATSDFGRYWPRHCQITCADRGVAGAAPLKSGQAFKFHFSFQRMALSM